MADTTYLTRDAYQRLKSELEELKGPKRNSILEKIDEARSHGDLSENAEYEAAREEQTQNEIRITNLERTLLSASILDEKNIKTDKVYILTTVKLKNLDSKEEIEYTLVAPEEADMDKGKISIKSPIGQALLRKAKGDKVEVKGPMNTMRFQIMEIKVK